MSVLPARVYFSILCCSFLFRYSLRILLIMDTPAPIPLAMGITISPTPVTRNVIAVEEIPNNKTPSKD